MLLSTNACWLAPRLLNNPIKRKTKNCRSALICALTLYLWSGLQQLQTGSHRLNCLLLDLTGRIQQVDLLLPHLRSPVRDRLSGPRSEECFFGNNRYLMNGLHFLTVLIGRPTEVENVRIPSQETLPGGEISEHRVAVTICHVLEPVHYFTISIQITGLCPLNEQCELFHNNSYATAEDPPLTGCMSGAKGWLFL